MDDASDQRGADRTPLPAALRAVLRRRDHTLRACGAVVLEATPQAVRQR